MKHFSEKEFWCRCNQCQKGDAEMGIPPGGMMGGVPENVKALVENVLDPLREKYGKPIKHCAGWLTGYGLRLKGTGAAGGDYQAEREVGSDDCLPNVCACELEAVWAQQEADAPQG